MKTSQEKCTTQEVLQEYLPFRDSLSHERTYTSRQELEWVLRWQKKKAFFNIVEQSKAFLSYPGISKLNDTFKIISDIRYSCLPLSA